METIILSPPFDPDQLAHIASSSLKEEWQDVRTTVRWLLRHKSVEAMTRSIKALWERSSLPLREWAYRVKAVEAWTTEKGSSLDLAVHLIGRGAQPVFQHGPFQPDELAECTRTFPGTLPDVLQEVSLTSPGLHVNRIGPLGDTTFFLHPLHHVLRRTRTETTPEVCSEYGCVYPDPTVFVMEVAENGQGCSYVLHMDGSLYFHDWPDLPGLIPCSVSVDRLVEVFFEAPETICDPYEAGWAKYPEH